MNQSKVSEEPKMSGESNTADEFRAITIDRSLQTLQQQIELSNKIDNFTFINEICIENFLKFISIEQDDSGTTILNPKYRNHINILFSYIIYLYESNQNNPEKLWLIYLMMKKFAKYDSRNLNLNTESLDKLALISNENYINLLIILLQKLPKLSPFVSDYYRLYLWKNQSLKMNEDLLQTLVIKLRNSLYENASMTTIILNILIQTMTLENNDDKNSRLFEKIYEQSLIHLFKNQNSRSIIELLIQCPDKVFENHELIQKLLKFLLQNNNNSLISLYSYALFGQSKLFMAAISDYSMNMDHNKDRQPPKSIDEDRFGQLDRYFGRKQCFLHAVLKREHFLDRFIDHYHQSIRGNRAEAVVDDHLTILPLKSQIILSTLSLYNGITSSNPDKLDQISKIEANLMELIDKYSNNHQTMVQNDEYFDSVIKKLMFVFKFADWCQSQANKSSAMIKYSNDHQSFRTEIITNLLNGICPLKILLNYNFLQLNFHNTNINNDDHIESMITCGFVCDLIENYYDPKLSETLNGIVCLRILIYLIIFVDNTDDSADRIESMLSHLKSILSSKIIESIDYRLEILENLFSLLFISYEHLKSKHIDHENQLKYDQFNDDDDDAEDYQMDETIVEQFDRPKSKSNGRKHSSSATNKSSAMTSSMMMKKLSSKNFLCPNWLIAKLLEIIETILYRTNVDLINQNDCDNSMSNDKVEKLKFRIRRLLRYVSDAKFRYEVIWPAFDSQQLMMSQSSMSSIITSTTTTTTSSSSISSTIDQQLNSLQSTNSGDNNQLINVPPVKQDDPVDPESNSKPNGHNIKCQNTSLISCMLSSYEQLLCYTLNENRLKNARQIIELFGPELFDTKPFKELQLLDYLQEFDQQIRLFNQQPKTVRPDSDEPSNSTEDMINDHKINDQTNANSMKINSNRSNIDHIINKWQLSSSQIQSILYEMLLKMDINIDQTLKSSLLLDYSLSKCPSLMISESIIESIVENSSNDLFRSKSSIDSMSSESKLPANVEIFLKNIQKFLRNLANHIDLDAISMNDYLKFSLPLLLSKKSTKTAISIFDVQSIIEELSRQNEIMVNYQRFQQLLNDLDNLMIDDPEISNNGDDNNDQSSKLNQIYEQLINQCKSERYQYLLALYRYIVKVNDALIECRKRDLSTNDNNNNDGKSIPTTIIYTMRSKFSILKQSPSAILCSMVIKSKISPKIIDDLADVMKVNLLSILCSVYCPSIPSTMLPLTSVEFTITELCQPSICQVIQLYRRNMETIHSKLKYLIINDYFSNDSMTINTSTIDNNNGGNTVDDDQSSEFQPLINEDVLNYFHCKCPILVEILRLLQWINDSNYDVDTFKDDHPRILNLNDDLPLSKWLRLIQEKFLNHRSSATSPSWLLLAFYPRIPTGQNSIIKILESLTSDYNYQQIYQLFEYLEDYSTMFDHHNQMINDNHLPFDQIPQLKTYQLFRNSILLCLAFIKEDYKYIFQIENDYRMKINAILYMVNTFEMYEQTFYATRLIRLTSQHINDDYDDNGDFDDNLNGLKLKLQKLLKEIEFYASVGQLTGLKSWKLTKINLDFIDILTIVKIRKRYQLIIDWYELNDYNLQSNTEDGTSFDDNCLDLVIELLILAFSEQNDYQSLKQFISKQQSIMNINSTNIIIIIEKLLNQSENLNLRLFLIDFLLQYYQTHNNQQQQNQLLIYQYQQHRLGIEIMKLLPQKLLKDYIDLSPIPSLIVEQLLMNNEIETLNRIINQFRLINADELVEKYAQKSVYCEFLYDMNTLFDDSDMTVISSDSSFMMMNNNNLNNSSFSIPTAVPSKDQWISDQSKTHCMMCNIVRFGMINRRHHCRRCGRVICSGCSSNSILIAEINPNIPVRVCDDCYVWSTKSISINSRSDGRKISVNSFDQSNSMINGNNNRIRTQWKLSIIDEQFNQNRRQEFSYESSPSVSLCLAILQLHSNKPKCCKFIVEKICAPLIETISSKNIDSTLLIEMIRSLLISTRVSFENQIYNNGSRSSTMIMNQESLQSNSINGIEQLNWYLDRLDVIRMLINANYCNKDLITLVLNNNIQKLQEKLLESERFELIIDISKKYGIEFSSIWKSWALIALKYLHFNEARQKFSRYFDQIKRPTDVQKTLRIIVDTLVSINSSYTMPQYSCKDKCSALIAGRFDFLVDSTRSTSNQASNRSKLKPKIFQEIIYYLQTYGTRDDQLQFYVNNFYWKEAIDVYLQSSSSIAMNATTTTNEQKSIILNNFLEKIFIPAQTNGQLKQLLQSLRSLDQATKLQRQSEKLINESMINVCKYLNRQSYYHSLNCVQIFMQDYLRAAITQINYFFLSTSLNIDGIDHDHDHDRMFQDSNQLISNQDNLNNFNLLYSRMKYLEKAKYYCNLYLQNIDYIHHQQQQQQNIQSADRGSTILIVDSKDVYKQIRLIELQMDILKKFKSSINVQYPVTIRVDLDDSNNWINCRKSPLILSSFAITEIYRQNQQLQLSDDKSNKSTLIQRSLSPPYPPTLLEHDPLRKSLITAYVILYYGRKSVGSSSSSSTTSITTSNNENSNYIEDGFRCALRIIQDHQLNGELIHRITLLLLLAQYLERNESLDKISRDLKQLLTIIRSTYDLDDDNGNDDNNNNNGNNNTNINDDLISIGLNFIDLLIQNLSLINENLISKDYHQISLMKLSELKEILIKLIENNNYRIDAYLMIGKLKLAYLFAAQCNQRSFIERVLRRAKQMNDIHYVKICEMWLRKNSMNSMN